ncbi:MAG: DUF599 domain-containing protein [Thermodesulfobacteriota bacterium]
MPRQINLASLAAEPGITAASFLLLIAYHILLNLYRRTHPGKGTHARHASTRDAWVRRMLQENQGILAVQTLRNWTMASSFLASTAILLGLALLNLLLASNQTGIARLAAMADLCADTAIPPKLLLISANFFFAFFNFTMAIRFYNHSGFMITPPLAPAPQEDVNEVINTVNRAAFHYTLGMRGYYMAVPLGLWLLGPSWLLAGTVLVIGTLWYADQTG